MNIKKILKAVGVFLLAYCLIAGVYGLMAEAIMSPEKKIEKALEEYAEGYEESGEEVSSIPEGTYELVSKSRDKNNRLYITIMDPETEDSYDAYVDEEFVRQANYEDLIEYRGGELHIVPGY